MRAFFFAPESPWPVALMRIAIGIVFLYDAAVRWLFAVELYSADGIPMPVFPIEFFPTASFEPLQLSAVWTVALHSLLVFSLLSVTIGWRTRISLAVAFSLSLWLGLLDRAGTFKKYSVIGLHVFMLLSFTRCGAVWSIDSFLGRRIRRHSFLSPAWPRRLLQVLVCAIYLGGVVTKIRLADFANGDLLMFSLLDDQWGSSFLGLRLSTRPNLLILASMGTILYEIAFPLLIWNRRLRRPLLIVACAFHLMLAATMQLGIFSFVMLAALLAFMEERDLRWLTHRIPASLHDTNYSTRRMSIVSATVWGVTAGVACGVGAFLHPHVEANTETRFETLDDATVTDMLASLTPAQELRFDDYFHCVELGNRLSADGTHTLGSSSQFRRGMTIHGCARLLQDHPPLAIEWTLTRPDGEEVSYDFSLAPSVSHATFGFELTDAEQTPPGEYRIVLRADGQIVATRGFILSEE